ALAFARGAVAVAATARFLRLPRGRGLDLRASAQFQRLVCIRGRPWCYLRRCQRGILECVAEIATNGPRTSDDGSLADDFRNGTVAGYRMDCRWQSRPVSLDRVRNLLPALSRGHRIVAYRFASLLADDTNVESEIYNHLPDNTDLHLHYDLVSR